MKNREEKLRQDILGKLTHNLGEVVVEDDRILCYVNAEKMDNFSPQLHLGTIYRDSSNNVEKYNFNKPIYFIFRHINFVNGLTLYCPVEEFNIVFENCDFERGIKIENAINVTFKNNEFYYCISPYKPCLYGYVENLKFENESFFLKSKTDNKYSLDLKVRNLEIIDSTFILDDKNGGVRIKANKIDMIDSDIKTHKEIEINTNKISLNNSNVISQNQITLNDKSNYNNIIEGVESPKTIYNGINLSALKFIGDNNLDKQKLRKILLEQLKTLKSNIEKTNINEIIELNKRR